MKAIITPSLLGGRIHAIPSKSDAHRILIASALSDKKTVVNIDPSQLSDDIKATVRSLSALGASFEYGTASITVSPVKHTDKAIIDCGESGSTLRFLIPVAAAICKQNKFLMYGRLSQRPIDELEREMAQKGCVFSRPNVQELEITGGFKSGHFKIAGNISSQYITGLLFALPLLEGDSEIELTSPLQSSAYVDMTLSILQRFGINVLRCGDSFLIKGNQKYVSPSTIDVEGDWSNSAFWLCAGAIGLPVTVDGISTSSVQADKKIIDILQGMGANIHIGNGFVCVSPGATLHAVDIDAEQIPDIVPIIAVTALFAEGKTTIYNAGRLRIKESDRIEAIRSLITAVGGNIRTEAELIEITGTPSLNGAEVSSFNDHRIVMSAAICAQYCSSAVTINGAQAVNKSYPYFFEDYKQLGGIVDVINNGK